MHLPGPSRPRVSSDNHDDLFRRIATAETPEDYKAIVDYIKSKRKFALICDNGLNGPLHHAIRHRKFELLSVLLSTNMLPVNELSLMQHTPLHLCLTEKVEIQFLEKLIAAGADVNIPDRRYQTPLHLAMKCDHRYAHLLIRHGALETINAKDLLLRTPLHYAVTERNFDNVFLLLYYNADTNIGDIGWQTPFMLTLRDPDFSCSIQEILLEYENAFLLEEYELDTYTQSRLCKLLRFCIRFKNLEMYKKIWSRISPGIRELILYEASHLIINAPFNYMDFLVRNDYIDLTKLEEFRPSIREIWETAACEDTDKQIKMFLNTVYLFLSYGAIFCVSDIQFLQRFRHYEAIEELIRVLLFMDIDKSVSALREFSDIPHIIPYVRCNINEKFEDIIDDYCRQFPTWFSDISLIFEEIKKNLKQFFRFSSSDKFLKLFKQAITLHLGDYWETPEMNVPSLVELSRNRAKDRICEKYEIKNACQFYTVLEYKIMIPRVVKDIIAFRTPIYEKANIQTTDAPM